MWTQAKTKYVGEIIAATTSARSMKDVGIMLQHVEEDTGYNKDFLAEVVSELVADGNTFKEAIENTVTVAYEYDF